MLFNSYQYFVFFGVVLLLYWGLRARERGRLRLWVLCLATYVFYATFTWWFVALPLVITAFDYQYGRSMQREESARTRKMLLAAACVVNLGMLATFKYLDFFITSSSELLDRLGLPSPDFALRLVLPVGLSFYVFQSLSYCIDIYRKKLEPERDLLVLATFIAFFPQIAAGPISRGGQLLPQLRNLPARLSSPDRRTGIDLIILGLFRKVVIGDVCARLARQAFAHTETGAFNYTYSVTNSGVLLIGGAFAFVLAFYGDFAGYSTMARGFAKLLGIDIPRNFARPLWSKSYPELWRRWHISLMNWLRDYIYYPLWFHKYKRLPIRRPLQRTAFATLVVFLSAGLWHGASGNWLLWGLLTGLIVVADATIRELLRQRRKRAAATASAEGASDATARALGGAPSGSTTTLQRTKVTSALSTGLQVTYTLALFTLLAVLIASPTIDEAIDVWIGIFTMQPGRLRPDLLGAIALAGVAVALSDRQEIIIEREERAAPPRRTAEPAADLAATPGDGDHAPARATISDWTWGVRTALLLAPVIVFSGLPADPFIYFKF